jgi:hypothetical protein
MNPRQSQSKIGQEIRSFDFHLGLGFLHQSALMIPNEKWKENTSSEAFGIHAGLSL